MSHSNMSAMVRPSGGGALQVIASSTCTTARTTQPPFFDNRYGITDQFPSVAQTGHRQPRTSLGRSSRSRSLPLHHARSALIAPRRGGSGPLPPQLDSGVMSHSNMSAMVRPSGGGALQVIASSTCTTARTTQPPFFDNRYGITDHGTAVLEYVMCECYARRYDRSRGKSRSFGANHGSEFYARCCLQAPEIRDSSR